MHPVAVVARHLEAPELAERERELAILASALARPPPGRGGMAVVTGEAGAGKTALLQAFCASRSSDGAARVLRGMCDALLTPQPLGPLHDIATDDGRRAARAPPGRSGALRGLHGAARRAATGGADDRRDRGRPLGGRGHARRDSPRRPPHRRRSAQCIAVSYREEELDARHPLRLMLGELASAVSLRRVPLSTPVAGRRRPARRAVPDRPGGAPSHDRRQRLLRDGGARIGRNGHPRNGARRRSRPSGAPVVRRTRRPRGRRHRAAARRDMAGRGALRSPSTRGSTNASPPVCSCPSTRTSRSGTSSPACPSRSRSLPHASARLHRSRARGAARAPERRSRPRAARASRGRSRGEGGGPRARAPRGRPRLLRRGTP